jgi:hypothetical protein
MAVDFPPQPLLFVGFNEKDTRLCVGMERGFAIFDCEADELRERVRRGSCLLAASKIFVLRCQHITFPFSDMGGGIGIVDQWGRSNYFVLAGGGKSPLYPPTQVIIWDDVKFAIAAKIEMDSTVISFRIRRDE